LLGYGLIMIVASLDFSAALGDETSIPIDNSPRQYLIAAAASFLSGSLASWLPARKAARVDPVDILRGAV
jgi:lipoprotein-releasing system permease protein